MGYGTTPNSTISADLVAADIDAIIDGICGDNIPAGYGFNSANLGDILYMMETFDSYISTIEEYLSGNNSSGPLYNIDFSAYEIDNQTYSMNEYLSGNYSGPLTYMEGYLYNIEYLLSDSASDGLIYQMQQDIAAMKTQLDKLTFAGDGALHITDLPPV